MNQKRMVCLCNMVSAQEIIKIIHAGAITTADIQKYTAAGTSCGRCKPEIDAIVEKYRTKSVKDPQLRISFE